MVPLRLEYPNDGEEGAEEEAPGPSSGTSSNAMTDSKKKSNLKRGQHQGSLRFSSLALQYNTLTLNYVLSSFLGLY